MFSVYKSLKYKAKLGSPENDSLNHTCRKTKQECSSFFAFINSLNYNKNLTLSTVLWHDQMSIKQNKL